MKIKFLFLITFSLLFFVASCSPVREPAIGNQISPLSPLATPLEAVTTDETGAVRGIFMHTSEEKGDRPVSGYILALSEMLTTKDGIPLAVGYDAESSPFTVTDEEGRFALNKIEPGLYGLMLDLVVDVMLLDDPANPEYTLLVKVEAGEVLDLGALKYESLPIAGFVE